MRPHNNFIVKIAVLTVIALLGLSLTVFAQATPPGRINYQGVLRDASGNPLDGPQTMTFRLYDDPSAGTLLWEEIYDPTVYTPQVTVTNGLFTVALGDATHRNAGSETVFTDLFANHSDVYLAVRIGSDNEMTPRIKVVSAPFAVNSSALGGRDSTAYAKLANAETITADWVNTAHPWSDNEVSNVLTLGPGSTIDSSIAVGNADTLDGFDSSYFLNTSSTDQTKAGKLTLNGTTGFGLDASGPSAGGYLHDSDSSGYSYVGYGDYGILAYGNSAGGYFKDKDGTGYAYVGYGDRGIDAYGNVMGGYFKDKDGTGYANVGFGDRGIEAYGNEMGGYFQDLDNSGYANVGYGNNGIAAYGNDTGGYFEDLDDSGYARVGYGNDGIAAYGNNAGGYFKDKDDTGYAYVGYGDRGIEAYGNDMGGYFEDLIGHGHAYVGFNENGISAYGNNMGGYFADPNASGKANVGYGDRGIEAYGNDMGGYFEDSDGSGYARVGYSDDGIQALGNDMGGYFVDLDSSGYAYVGYGDYGISAQGNIAGGYFKDRDDTGYAYVGHGDAGIEAYGFSRGGYFEDLDDTGHAYLASGDWGISASGNTGGAAFSDANTGVHAYVGYNTSKIWGTGSVSFVQNHPYDKGKVIVYACPEGDEVATYTRGTAKLVNGEARVKLGETFKWVTNPDIGLTAHITPKSKDGVLYVESVSTSELVIKSVTGFAPDAVFDYIVYGLRIGFEESSIVQEKQQESYIPSFKDHRERYAKYPELRAFNSLERFKTMETDVRGGVERSSIDLSRAKALKDAIHEYDPATDPPVDQLFGLGVVKNEQEAVANNQAVRNNPVPSRLPPLSPTDGTTVKRQGSTYSEIITDTRRSLPCFEANGSIEAGDVVTMDPSGNGSILKSVTQADPRVLGIAAGEGFRCQGDKAGKKAGTGIRVPVATFGVTNCKVDAGFGPIIPGDLLIASPTPGHAMRADNPAQGTVIGKALEKLDTGTGLIKVLVMLR